GLDARMAPVVLSGAYLQRAGVFSLQQPMPPGIKPPQHCASPDCSGLPAILRQRFIPDSRQYSTLRIASQFPVINTHTHKFCWKFFCQLASFLTAG
ncbi:hypothetical protein ACUJ7E_002939, partial [Escherichia fergusonii]